MSRDTVGTLAATELAGLGILNCRLCCALLVQHKTRLRKMLSGKTVEIFKQSGKDVSYKKIVVSSQGDKTNVECIVANGEIRPITTIRRETKKLFGIPIECTQTTEYREDLRLTKAAYIEASVENKALVAFERRF